MRPGHWLWLVLCISFSALTLMAGWWQEGHPACNHVPLIRNGSVPEQMEEEDSRGEPADPGSCGKNTVKQSGGGGGGCNGCGSSNSNSPSTANVQILIAIHLSFFGNTTCNGADR